MSKRSFKDNINELYEANMDIIKVSVSEYSITLALGACIEFLKLMYRMNMITSMDYLKRLSRVHDLANKRSKHDHN